MCRRKPGSRCHQHSARSFAASQRRVAAARAEMVAAKQAGDPDRVKAAQQEVTRAAERHMWARADLDCTRAVMDQLHTIANNPDLPQQRRDAAKARIDTALTLRDARKQHIKLMPTLPVDATAEARKVFNELGVIRERMARWDTLTATGKTPDTAASRQYRTSLEMEAFTAEVTLHAATVDHADLAQLNTEEARLLHTKPGSDLANELVYLSHARAVLATNHHPQHVTDVVAARESRLHNEMTQLIPEGPRRTIYQATPPPAVVPAGGRPRGGGGGTPRSTGRDMAGWQALSRVLRGNRSSRGFGKPDVVQIGKHLDREVIGAELQTR